jgi:hypothetical protein
MVSYKEGKRLVEIALRLNDFFFLKGSERLNLIQLKKTEEQPTSQIKEMSPLEDHRPMSNKSANA